MRRTAGILILGALVTAQAHAGPPRPAHITRLLTTEESHEIAAMLGTVVAHVERALVKASGLHCVPAPGPGDGLDTATGSLRRQFGAAVHPGIGAIPRLSATISCAEPRDGGGIEPIDVHFSVSAHTMDRVNILPPQRPALVRSTHVMIVDGPAFRPGLAAYIGDFQSRDAGVAALDRPALMLELRGASVSFASAIAAELDSDELLVAIRLIRPIPPANSPGPEESVTLTPKQREETERAVVTAAFQHTIGVEPTLVEEPARGSEMADWAGYHELAPELRQSLFVDFEKRRDSGVLPPIPEGSRFISRKEVRRVLRGPGDWEKFRKAYPGFPRLTTISPVALSADGTQALIYLGWRGGPLWAEGATYILVRSGGVWRVNWVIGHWLS